MNTPALALCRRLAAIDTNSAFATRFAVAADPQIHVEAVGDIPLPVTIHSAHQLCAAAQPAAHGYKDQTRVDPRVRDTWEIPASRIRCNSPQWQFVLDRALERIRHDLGLPRTARLKAKLHNLLVYAPGQFFAVHQDSEKDDGMLGTLVVTLPSRFTGGEFVVSHQAKTLRSRSSASRLGMVAFYADCHHEVRPVKQGYRVVLTYNLLVQGDAQDPAVSARDVTALADAVRAFWDTPTPPRWTGDTDREPPDRLVYLLDHQYTPSGLSWARLKGADATRTAALQRMAEQLDAEIFLALADVHETWSAEDDYQSRSHWDYAEDEDEDEAPDDELDDPALEDLIDSDVELRHWIAPDGGQLASDANGVDPGELCFTRPSADCTPFRSEHEGYMGNYGNTVDRWYHRAAVVMWPRERAFVIRARQSPGWALAQITSRFEADDPAQAREWAQRLLPLWEHAAAGTQGTSALLGAALRVAVALDDGDTAAALLAPFSLQQLTSKMARWIMQLLQQHGLAWCGERLNQWAASWQAPDRQLAWLAQTLPTLTRAWCTATSADGSALATMLLEERWHWLQAHITELQVHAAGTARIHALADTSPALLALIRGSRSTGQSDLHSEVIDTLLSAQLPLQVPLGVLHAAGSDVSGLAAMHAHCTRTLATRLAQPKRAAADWSILPPTNDAGELGEILAQFLKNPAVHHLEWPLAKDKRQLIHRFIDRYELPVRHETRRTGRPYVLVLDKTRELFKRAATERRQWAKELAWLQQRADRFCRRGASLP